MIWKCGGVLENVDGFVTWSLVVISCGAATGPEFSIWTRSTLMVVEVPLLACGTNTSTARPEINTPGALADVRLLIPPPIGVAVGPAVGVIELVAEPVGV